MAIAFNAAIAAYGNKERWAKVVDVYELMPENLRPELKGWHLGAVIMAHARAEDKEAKLRALEIFNQHKDKVSELAYGGAITALLDTEQFDEALALAENMKHKEIAWGRTCTKLWLWLSSAAEQLKKPCSCWRRAFAAWG